MLRTLPLPVPFRVHLQAPGQASVHLTKTKKGPGEVWSRPSKDPTPLCSSSPVHLPWTGLDVAKARLVSKEAPPGNRDWKGRDNRSRLQPVCPGGRQSGCPFCGSEQRGRVSSHREPSAIQPGLVLACRALMALWNHTCSRLGRRSGPVHRY